MLSTAYLAFLNTNTPIITVRIAVIAINSPKASRKLDLASSKYYWPALITILYK